MKYVLPILLGRLVRIIARARGGGSAYPGYLVLKLLPSFLTDVTKQFDRGVLFVLGSNGKSTTTHMLSDVMRAHGLRVFTNPTGANLPQGIASALLSEVSIFGKLKADVGVLEVDEAFAVELSGHLHPSTVLMLNVQVDQLYRFYETSRVADMMTDTAATAGTHVVTNRDDEYLGPFTSSTLDVTRFGASTELVAEAPHGLQNASAFGGQTEGSAPLHAEAEVRALSAQGATIALSRATGGGSSSLDIRLPAKGLHYAVDAAAAIQTARVALGSEFDESKAVAAFAAMKPAYGRGERLKIGTDEAEFVMFKNAASLQLNLDALTDAPEQVLLAIDEGTPDISWIYDVDFSSLDHVDVVSGEKAWQIALRLEHAGIPIGTVEPRIEKAIELMRALPAPASKTKNFIVNYEQMMIARKMLGYPDLEKRA
ncbi:MULTISPECIES: MurT ligase domain-containing protein [unclassified Frondihabitans]|uniref:MurT ligase domain-containing protein n=1 Tax=unclassified Frondihabitans TaxID=2626248 RepID=UPI000F4FDABE|nr:MULTISPECIES: MurT ligase domain-containing protein [unclassified Frondihabitans]RPE75174.1 UDP-N-acetylmuramyl tripeptide synthase [Frondihabitans sp. PhB153]RPF04416.1 UDP-N-acetylmuramyl tripeptide synthase [Frondihabitans sp. PhB161]